MAAMNFFDWQLDPLFQAAEDVQDSADRLESSLRAWQQDCLGTEWKPTEMEGRRLKLVSASDTLRWQLEVFERAIKEPYGRDDRALQASALNRRQQFVSAIREALRFVQLSIHLEVPREALTLPSESSSSTVGASQQLLELSTVTNPALVQFFSSARAPGTPHAPSSPSGGASVPGPGLPVPSSVAPQSLPLYDGVAEAHTRHTHDSDPSSHCERRSEACKCLAEGEERTVALLQSASDEKRSTVVGMRDPCGRTGTVEQEGGTQSEQVLISRDGSGLVLSGTLAKGKNSEWHRGSTLDELEDGGKFREVAVVIDRVESNEEDDEVEANVVVEEASGRLAEESAGMVGKPTGRHLVRDMQGWSCILFWVRHLHRSARRKQLEGKEVGRGSESTTSFALAAQSGSSSSLLRPNAVNPLPFGRTLSASSLSTSTQFSHAQPSWVLPAPFGDDGNSAANEDYKKQLVAGWHLGMKPRRPAGVPHWSSQLSLCTLAPCIALGMILLLLCLIFSVGLSQRVTGQR